MIFSTEALVKYEKNANVTQLEIPLYGHQAKKKCFVAILSVSSYHYFT